MKILIVIATLFALSMNTISIEKKSDETTETRTTTQSMFRNAHTQLAAIDTEGF